MSRIGNLGDGPLRLDLLDQSLCSEPFPWACLRGVIEAKTAEWLAQCFPSDGFTEAAREEIGRPSLVASYWKSIAHTIFGVSAAGTGG
jgi:hypothetical protein